MGKEMELRMPNEHWERFRRVTTKEMLERVAMEEEEEKKKKDPDFVLDNEEEQVAKVVTVIYPDWQMKKMTSSSVMDFVVAEDREEVMVEVMEIEENRAG